MFKAKEVSLKNVAVVLLAAMAVSAGYYLSRGTAVVSRSVPVFMGEEVVVHKTALSLTAAKTMSAAKTVTAPAPAPNPAVPLPIIPPTITAKFLPAYPANALKSGVEGTVLLSVLIGANGQPEKIEAKTSSGMAEFDASAVKAVEQWKFSPATQAGAALASWLEIPVKFVLK